MALARVKATTGTTGATFPTSLTTTAFGTATTSGNLIIVAVLLDGLASAQTITVTDSKSNAYVKIGAVTLASVDQIQIFASWNITGGTSHTITANTIGNTTAAIIAEEWSGAPTTNSFDKTTQATDNTGTSTAVNTGATAATTQANEIVFVAASSTGTTATATLGSGYTNLTSVTSNPSKLHVESKVVSATGAQTGTLTLSAGATWTAVVVTISDTAPTAVAHRLMLMGMGA